MKTYILRLPDEKVRMISDGGTIFNRAGSEVGEASKGSEWYTVQLEWRPGEAAEDVHVLLRDRKGNVTWASPSEFKPVTGRTVER